MLILVILLVFALCFSVFNYWFQKEKYKTMTENEKRVRSIFNSPSAWLTYTIICILIILGIISYYAYQLMSAVMKLRQ